MDFGLSCYPLSFGDELEYHQDHCKYIYDLSHPCVDPVIGTVGTNSYHYISFLQA